MHRQSTAALRSTPTTLILLASTIVAGLGSRAFPSALPDVVAQYAGDVLWASMVFFALALLRQTARTAPLAAGALAIAIAVETSQLYHAPWIDAIRATTPGALMLGQGFLWTDIVCYSVGVFLAACIDAVRVRAVTPAGS